MGVTSSPCGLVASPPGWIKMNFGSSVFSTARRCDAGFMARDQKVSVPLAEIIAALNFIRVAIFRIGDSILWIEGVAQRYSRLF